MAQQPEDVITVKRLGFKSHLTVRVQSRTNFNAIDAKRFEQVENVIDAAIDPNWIKSSRWSKKL